MPSSPVRAQPVVRFMRIRRESARAHHKKGVNASGGPRIAHVHPGPGGAGISSGLGLLGISTSSSEKSRSQPRKASKPARSEPNAIEVVQGTVAIVKRAAWGYRSDPCWARPGSHRRRLFRQRLDRVDHRSWRRGPRSDSRDRQVDRLFPAAKCRARGVRTYPHPRIRRSGPSKGGCGTCRGTAFRAAAPHASGAPAPVVGDATAPRRGDGRSTRVVRSRRVGQWDVLCWWP